MDIKNQDIDDLLYFLPIFENPEKSFLSSWGGGTKNNDDSITMPHPIYSDDVVNFFNLAAKPCWTDHTYNSKAPKNILENERLIKNASLSQIKTMLTYCVRGERFCDGHWVALLESGKIVLLLKRLRVLRNNDNLITHIFLKQTADAFRELAEQIEQSNYEETKKISINFSEIDANKTKQVCSGLSKWERENKGSRFIYILKSSSETDINRCFHQFSAAKSKKPKERAFAKINQISNVFYVGSSNSLGKRIKEHFGFGSKGTYALQMAHWINGIIGEFSISIWRFSGNLNQDVLQAIEDGLWKEYKPMFGRKGAAK